MLTVERISGLVEPYIGLAEAGTDWPDVYGKLGTYLELILKWNAQMNLTAIREPEEIVRRHFGESLFVSGFLGGIATLLDYGSGAGFPGVPIQIVRPDLRVTLAESQGKKAAFLREVVRELDLTAEVWGSRVERMPQERRFDGVVMRAVDKMEAAIQQGAGRALDRLLILGTSGGVERIEGLEGFGEVQRVEVPESRDGFLFIAKR
jgi:16S rRNA (guanine527-N7)-methyltransferase